MINHRKYVIEREAEKEAEIIIREIDPIKKEYFLKGATFAAKYLLRQLEVHPMEDEAIQKYLEKARIKSIREAVQAMLALEPKLPIPHPSVAKFVEKLPTVEARNKENV